MSHRLYCVVGLGRSASSRAVAHLCTLLLQGLRIGNNSCCDADRVPHNKIVGCASASSKVLEIKATFATQCKAGNLDLPYVHRSLPEPVRMAVELEFEGSMTNLMPQLMHVLDISKTVNFTEKDERLKARPELAAILRFLLRFLLHFMLHLPASCHVLFVLLARSTVHSLEVVQTMSYVRAATRQRHTYGDMFRSLRGSSLRTPHLTTTASRTSSTSACCWSVACGTSHRSSNSPVSWS